MPPLGSGQAPVAFCDVAAHFSEEEWELLHEWQKELYRNVMKEIHQALISLGPLIATSVFSLRPKEKNELRSALLPDLQTEVGSVSPPSSVLTAEPNVLFLETKVGNQHQDPCSTKREDVNKLRSGHDDATPVVPLIVKEEGDTYSIEHYDHERREITADDTQFPICNIDQEECLAEYHNKEREESSTCPNTGPEESIPATSVGINEEGQTYSFSIQGYRKQQSINNSPSQGLPKRKNKNEQSEKHPNKNIQCTTSSGKVRITKKSKQITSSKSQLWSDRNLKLGVVQSENACVNKIQYRLQQSIPKVGKMTNHNLWLAHPFVGQTHSTEHQKTKAASSSKERHFQCTECNKSFIQKVHLIRHQRTHSGERPYHCTECEKSFSQKHHLLGHLRTHSGEKPFQCAKCMKRFCWKEGLYRHQRTHVCPMQSYT